MKEGDRACPAGPREMSAILFFRDRVPSSLEGEKKRGMWPASWKGGADQRNRSDTRPCGSTTDPSNQWNHTIGSRGRNFDDRRRGED